MGTNQNLAVLLKNPTKTSNAIDSILQEIKEQSRAIAEKRIEEVSNEIRNKHFNLLEKSSLEKIS